MRYVLLAAIVLLLPSLARAQAVESALLGISAARGAYDLYQGISPWLEEPSDPSPLSSFSEPSPARSQRDSELRSLLDRADRTPPNYWALFGEHGQLPQMEQEIYDIMVGRPEPIQPRMSRRLPMPMPYFDTQGRSGILVPLTPPGGDSRYPPFPMPYFDTQGRHGVIIPFMLDE